MQCIIILCANNNNNYALEVACMLLYFIFISSHILDSHSTRWLIFHIDQYFHNNSAYRLLSCESKLLNCLWYIVSMNFIM